MTGCPPIGYSVGNLRYALNHLERKLGDLTAGLAKGYFLLNRCSLLIYMTLLVVFILYGPLNAFPGAGNREGANILFVILFGIFVGFVVHPFLRAALIGSYVQILGKEAVTMEEFIHYGQRYYRPFVTLLLLMILFSIPLGLLGAVMMGIFEIPMTIFQDPPTWFFIGGGLFAMALVPFIELAPMMIVLTGKEPLKAVIESYKLIYLHFDTFLPFLVFIWGIPIVLHWVAGEMMPGTYMERWGSQLVQFFFMVIGIPTMVVYLSERIGTLGYPAKKISTQ